MYQNIHYPVAALQKGEVKSPGLCFIKYFRWEDVLIWPEVNPLTGAITSSVTMKPGAYIYLCESINPSRNFTETKKESSAGPYFDITAKALLSGSAITHSLTLGTMLHHTWGLILNDKNGVPRLVGNRDAGAELFIDYTSGEGTESRKTAVKWEWQHTQPTPVYSSDAFDIVIGGEVITAGCIQYLKRFEVGGAGSPMNDGDTVYVNAALAGKKPLVIVDGMVLPVDDGSGEVDWTGSIQRRVEKTTASNTMVFVGGVVDKEIIEIYAFS